MLKCRVKVKITKFMNSIRQFFLIKHIKRAAFSRTQTKITLRELKKIFLVILLLFVLPFSCDAASRTLDVKQGKTGGKHPANDDQVVIQETSPFFENEPKAHASLWKQVMDELDQDIFF